VTGQQFDTGTPHLLIHEIERGFVDEAHIQALLTDAQYRIITAIQHVAVRDNVSILALEDDLILTRNKFIATPEELLFRVWLEDIWYLCARGENEADASLEEDTLDDRLHLQGVCGEVQPGVHIIETIVTEERVETEVTSVVGHLINYGASTTGTQHAGKVQNHVPPEWEKWQSKLQLFKRAMVSSEMTISRKAEKVEKTPNLSGSNPKPAAADKFPRSMIPEGTNTSGCLLWMTFKPVEPSKSPVRSGIQF